MKFISKKAEMVKKPKGKRSSKSNKHSKTTKTTDNNDSKNDSNKNKLNSDQKLLSPFLFLNAILLSLIRLKKI